MLNYAGREKWQEATQQELDAEARGKNLGEWLKGKEPVNPQLNELYKQTLGEFKSFDDPDEWDTYKYPDTELCGALVAEIIVESNDTLRFRLHNGLELRESIERTVR